MIGASKAFYVGLAFAAIVALTVPVAYPVWLATVQKPSPYNSVSVSNSTLGIRLDLSVVSTSIKAGGSITITIDLRNTRSVENQIATVPNWNVMSAANWNQIRTTTNLRSLGLSMGPCNFDSPVGLAIVRGYYTKDTILAGHPLALWHPGIYFCQDEAAGGIYSYIFDPDSSRATIVTYQGPNTTFKLQTENRVQFSGYWNPGTQPLEEDASFQPFFHGIYTLVGGDEWGDLILLNFSIS